jgi:glycosyltransferase involved in cell wall biosynthesis
LLHILKDTREGHASVARRLFRTILRSLQTPVRPILAEHLVFCSAALREQYAAMGLRVGQGAVIFNGVARDTFSLRPQHILQRLPDEAYRLLYSGRIASEKGVTTLVKALRRLRAVPGFEATTLTLLGAGQGTRYAAELGKLIRELRLEEAILFEDHRPRASLTALYQQHDVLVFPSEWKEPFGLSLIEGMVTGLPVISTLSGGPSEIVRDGENGIAFRAGDVADLVEKLRWVLSHPAEAAAIGRSASAFVSSHFSLERQVQSIRAYLLSLLGAGATRVAAEVGA